SGRSRARRCAPPGRARRRTAHTSASPSSPATGARCTRTRSRGPSGSRRATGTRALCCGSRASASEPPPDEDDDRGYEDHDDEQRQQSPAETCLWDVLLFLFSLLCERRVDLGRRDDHRVDGRGHGRLLVVVFERRRRSDPVLRVERVLLVELQGELARVLVGLVATGRGVLAVLDREEDGRDVVLAAAAI